MLQSIIFVRVLSSIMPKSFKTADAITAPVQLKTSKRWHISARLVKSFLVCMFGHLAGEGENLDESKLETESLYLSTEVAASDIDVDI